MLSGFPPPTVAPTPVARAPKRKRSKGKVIAAVVGGLFVLVILAAALGGDPDDSAADIEPPGGEGDDSSGRGTDAAADTSLGVEARGDEGGGADPSPTSANLTVTMVDVGQGDAVVLRTQSTTVVFDTGDRFASSHGKLISHLQAEGISTVQALVLSHPHADHAGGCAAVLDSFTVGLLVHPGVAYDAQTWQDCLNTAAAKNVPIITGAPFGIGDAFEWIPGASAQVVHVDASASDVHDANLGIRVTYGSFAVMLPGDLECGKESEAISRGLALDVTVLNLGHHGSSTSSCAPWLDALTPEVATAGVGQGNQYGHPHQEVRNRLTERSIPLYTTAEHGNIIIETNGQTWDLRTQKAPAPSPSPTATPSPSPSPSPTPTPSPAPSPTASPHASGIVISATQFDPPGNDQGDNLVNEWVELTNTGCSSVSLNGWRVEDAIGTAYSFPSAFSLAPGASVKIRTGHGDDTATDLFWDRGSAVWNNTGDTAYVYDAAGNLVDSQAG